MRFDNYLIESPRSDAHEEAIADGFRGRILPIKIPKWMEELGFAPGAKVTRSLVTGGTGIKPDIIVTFDRGPTLRISAKLSNADFFGNWYSKRKVRADLGDELVRPLSDVALEFSKKFRNPKREDPFVGVSISFGKRGGQTAKKFTDLFPVNLVKRIVAGGSPHSETNANSLYATDDVPQSIGALLNQLKPISNNVIKNLSKDFNIIFRPVYTGSNKTNMSKPAWTQLVATEKLEEPTLIDLQTALLKHTRWVPTPLEKDVTHNTIVRELKKSNILVPKK